MKHNALVILLLVGFLTACTTLYTGVVSLTQIVDDAAKSYASAFNSGLVPPDVATKVSTAFAKYQQAAGIAHDALVAYKLGQTTDTRTALEAARVAASEFISALVPILTRDKTARFQQQIAKATSV